MATRIRLALTIAGMAAAAAVTGCGAAGTPGQSVAPSQSSAAVPATAASAPSSPAASSSSSATMAYGEAVETKAKESERILRRVFELVEAGSYEQAENYFRDAADVQALRGSDRIELEDVQLHSSSTPDRIVLVMTVLRSPVASAGASLHPNIAVFTVDEQGSVLIAELRTAP